MQCRDGCCRHMRSIERLYSESTRSVEEVLPRLQNEAKAQLLAAVVTTQPVTKQPEIEITNQTESRHPKRLTRSLRRSN